jgi:hypothetical protein
MAKSSKYNLTSTPPFNAIPGSACPIVAVKQPRKYFCDIPIIKKYWQEKWQSSQLYPQSAPAPYLTTTNPGGSEKVESEKSKVVALKLKHKTIWDTLINGP